MQFQRGNEVLFSDDSAFQQGDVVLPPRQWVTIEVDYGLYDQHVFEIAETVWFQADTVGDRNKHRWQIAVLEGVPDNLPEW
jgi:hypothetical protein